MTTAQKSVDVGVPVRTAYNQWTQFDEFPRFMDDVESITPLDDRHLRRKVKVAGIERAFDAETTEQNPDERIAWRATGGVDQSDMKNFKEFIESRSAETGDWHGTVRREGWR